METIFILPEDRAEALYDCSEVYFKFVTVVKYNMDNVTVRDVGLGPAIGPQFQPYETEVDSIFIITGERLRALASAIHDHVIMTNDWEEQQRFPELLSSLNTMKVVATEMFDPPDPQLLELIDESIVQTSFAIGGIEL